MKQKFYFFLLTIFYQLVASAQPATHLHFDGSNDFVNLGTAVSTDLNGTTALTLEAWINPSALNGWNNIITDYDGAYHKFLLRVRNSNNIQFVLNGTFLNSSFTVPLNSWTHIAAVYDGSNMYVYANGNLIASQTATVSIPTGSQQINIGSRIGASTENFTGNIDEIRVWNTARTAEQINGSKNCELAGTESGLVAYYNFNQGVDQANNSTITTLNDITANGNNGTLTNFTLNGTTSNWLAGSSVTTGSVVPSVATVTTPVVYTQGASASALTATTGANGTGLIWYTTAIGGTGSATAPTPSTASVGSTSYWVSSTNANGCESGRVEIVVTVNAPIPATHLHFDGSNDLVNLGTSLNTVLDPLNTITVEAWVRPTTNTGLGVIIGNYANPNQSAMQFLLRRDNNSYAFWMQGTGGFTNVTATNTVVLNTWQHIVGVWNGSDLRLYVDGNLVATTTGVNDSSFATTTNTVMIGNNQAGTGAERFTGSIDDVRIWSTPRTIEQINGSKNCELAGTEAGLLAYYNFNQGNDQEDNSTVTTLNATTGPNGTLTNFTLNGTTSNWLAGSPVTTGSVVPSVATVTTPVVYTQGDTASALTATPGTNGTGVVWYTTATGGTGSTTAPTPLTATVGNTSYWVSSTNANGCESGRVEIVVNVVVVNDECPNAINLTVGSSSFSDFPENVLLTTATNSGSPAPTCGNFQGGDVWYTATVPASGNIVIETDGTGIYDTGLEVYSGACGALNLVSCDDNSGNGDYSKIVLLGQTPGTVLRIRVWENVFGISNAQFQVSAYDYVNPATHLSFDGTNDFVVSANAITNNTQNQTYQAWFRIPSVPTNSDRILQRGSDGSGGWSVQIDVTSTGRLSAGISASPDTFLTGTTVLNPNTWYQATFVFENNNSLRLYLDGNLEASVSIGNRVLRNSDNRLRIGTGNIASEFFRGDIDEVRIWNIALTATDIINTMNCETQQQPELVAHYKLNQGFDAVSNASETTAADSSGNGNNGTLTNFALTGVTSNWASGSVITTGNTCATLSSSDFENSAAITIYPNPSNGIFNIVSQENISIEVYDLIGKLIMSQKLSVGTNSFDISNFNTGVYLLKVINGNGKTQTHKLIKN